MSWALANEIGYKPITTFWEDFSIAEKFGSRSIEETAERCFKEWKHDYKYLNSVESIYDNLDIKNFESITFYSIKEFKDKLGNNQIDRKNSLASFQQSIGI